MASSLIQPAASSLINAITGKGVVRTGIGQEGAIFPLLELPLMMKVLGKGVIRTGKGVRRAKKGLSNMDHMDNEFLVSLHLLSNIEITNYFNYKPRFNGVFSRDNLHRWSVCHKYR